MKYGPYFILILLCISCSTKSTKKSISSQQTPRSSFSPGAFYSRTGLDYAQLEYLYGDTPIHVGQNLSSFIQYINMVEYPDLGYKIDTTLYSKFQTFVDTNGTVDTIFLLRSLDRKLDSLVFKALSTSKFKRLHMDGLPKMYSFIVEYLPKKNNQLQPKINDAFVEDSLIRKPMTILDDKLESEADLRQPPYIDHKEEAVYPTKAQEAGIEGMVILDIVIDKEGNVVEARVVKTDHILLNQPSIDAALKCKFQPGRINGKAVKSRLMLDYKFVLNPN